MSGVWDRTGVKKIVVHHLGNSRPPLASEAELRYWANPYGYEFPEYEWGILADGTVISLRPLTYVGAHTQADREKYNYGPNWWNRNSASIVIGNDNTKFPPTEAQIDSLVRFLIRWCNEKQCTFDEVYPHFQVTQTDCPGAVSQSLGLSTGAWMDWDDVGRRVNEGLTVKTTVMPEISTSNEQEAEEVKGIVAVYGPKDIMNGLALAEAKGLGLCLQSQVDVWKGASPLYWVGGSPLHGEGVVNLCGTTFKETMEKVISEL